MLPAYSSSLKQRRNQVGAVEGESSDELGAAPSALPPQPSRLARAASAVRPSGDASDADDYNGASGDGDKNLVPSPPLVRQVFDTEVPARGMVASVGALSKADEEGVIKAKAEMVSLGQSKEDAGLSDEFKELNLPMVNGGYMLSLDNLKGTHLPSEFHELIEFCCFYVSVFVFFFFFAAAYICRSCCFYENAFTLVQVCCVGLAEGLLRPDGHGHPQNGHGDAGDGGPSTLELGDDEGIPDIEKHACPVPGVHRYVYLLYFVLIFVCLLGLAAEK
jgi:hypothetical protein